MLKSGYVKRRNKSIDKIYHKAESFGLIAEFINADTLRLYSPKYAFDSWMVTFEKEENYIVLHHQNKKRNKNKCQYHIQNRFRPKNWLWLLIKIEDHNKFVTENHSKNMNLVDRVMNKYNLKTS